MTLIVVDDRGHGGADSGAYFAGIKEKDITFNIGKYFTKSAKEIGINVRSVRSTDITVPTGDRSAYVRNSGAKYCISHHVNSSSVANSANGVEIWVSQFSDKRLAKEVMREFDKLGLDTSRGIRTRKLSNGKDYYFMHRMTGNVRTLIIEYGFINNTKDREFLTKTENQKKLGEAVVRAIAKVENIKIQEKDTVKDNYFFRVVTGSFNDRDNAEKRISELKKLGFNSFIEVYKK